VSHGLYPPELIDLGLVAALQSVKRRTLAPLSLYGDGAGRYSPDVESAVYYACLEAMQNATKHGGPNPRITVTLFQDGDQVRFQVEDDGVPQLKAESVPFRSEALTSRARLEPKDNSSVDRPTQ
jgi:signal transduction histidine kinase